MNKIVELKSFRVLKLLIDAAFWLSVIFCTVSLVAAIFLNNFDSDALSFNIKFDGGFIGGENIIDGEYVPKWISIVTFGISSTAGIIILFFIRRIVRSVVDLKLFVIQNVNRLRLIALTIFIQSYCAMFTGFISAQGYEAMFKQMGIESFVKASLDVFPTGAIVALGVIVLAEIFRYGCILQDAYDTTV